MKESLQNAGLKTLVADEIYVHCQNNVQLIHNYLSHLKMETLAFNDLEWRIDIKLATRSMRKIVEPEILLKLNLRKGETKEGDIHLLQTDVSNLVHLTTKLEEALNETKNNYCRRVFRNIV